MKQMSSVVSLIVFITFIAFSQDSTFKFIFVPHVRSEDQQNQTVNPGIAKIDFSRYSLKMLGGDLAYNTSKSRTTMKYLDSLFDLKNPNTLWSLGNHDIEEGDTNLIKEFTGRPLFYSYARDGITFVVLNTELAANGFTATYIKSPQLDTLKSVCEKVTSADTKFFIVLHSRYMWMIGNSYFTQTMKDSIAASSKSMTETNWYADIEPLLKNVQAKGIKVIVFGGDKSKINVTYTKDSITYYAARMENTFSDSVNNCIVINYVKNKSITCTYVTLKDINKDLPVDVDVPIPSINSGSNKNRLIISRTPNSHNVDFSLRAGTKSSGKIRIYSVNGTVFRTISLNSAASTTIHFQNAGIYIAGIVNDPGINAMKFIVQ